MGISVRRTSSKVDQDTMANKDKEMSELRTAYVFHVLNLVFHQLDQKEKIDLVSKQEETYGKTVSLQNVFELVEALGDDVVESKIMKQAENPEI